MAKTKHGTRYPFCGSFGLGSCGNKCDKCNGQEWRVAAMLYLYTIIRFFVSCTHFNMHEYEYWMVFWNTWARKDAFGACEIFYVFWWTMCQKCYVRERERESVYMRARVYMYCTVCIAQMILFVYVFLYLLRKLLVCTEMVNNRRKTSSSADGIE